MLATQTIASASLAIAVVSSGLARADPDGAPTDPGVVRPEEPLHHDAGSLQLGAGYTTYDRLFLHASIVQPNLFGTGDLLSLDALVSVRRELFRARFVDPHVFDTDFVLSAELYSDRRVLPNLARAAAGGALTIARPLGDHVRAYLTYRVEHASVTIDPDAPPSDAPPWRGGVYASTRVGFAYSTLDAPLLATRGTSVAAAIEFVDPRLGSDLSLVRVDASASTNQRLGPVVLHVAGAFHAVDGPFGVPLSERLYLDGMTDLRGYAPGALAATGGTRDAFGRIELEVPVVRRIGLSVQAFCDAGAIYDDHGNGGFGRTLGFGITWRSPLGPLRLDYAFPLAGAPGFVFGIGAPLLGGPF